MALAKIERMNYQNSLAFAKGADQKDPLKEFRKKFFLPQHDGKDCIYLTGNSLGLQAKTTSAYVQQELDDWAKLGVEGHFKAKNPWLPYHEIFPKQVAKIIGCKENEVVVMNQLTVNLHLLMVSFYRPTKKRFKIICETRAFPSDQYAFETQVRYHGFDPAEAVIEAVPREGEHTLREEDIVSLIKQHGDSVAVVLFGGVNYYTGQLFDMKTITGAAHAAGAYAGFDLAHAAGNVELQLHDWNVDFACWCSYKYLNSGPGGVGGVYIHEKHVGNSELPRFAGWWGYTKETRFNMEKGFEAIPTAEGWQLSNAPVLSMAAHKASLDIFEEAGMERLHQKRRSLSAYLHYVLNDINGRQKEKVIEIITPSNEEKRGCQVSMLMLRRGKDIFNELTKQGVIADWREPNVIRVAPVPLYNSFEDIWRFGQVVENTLQSHD
ncbi:MAG: kynureninase [Chitinophagaceae bacterium]